MRDWFHVYHGNMKCWIAYILRWSRFVTSAGHPIIKTALVSPGSSILIKGKDNTMTNRYLSDRFTEIQ